MAAVTVSVTMRSYKHYFMLVLVPYLFLILMFHTQLQLYDNNALHPDSLSDSRQGLSSSDFAAQSYHIRSLRIKNASSSDDMLYHRGLSRGQGLRVDAQPRLGSRINMSQDVVMQVDWTMYYKSAGDSNNIDIVGRDKSPGGGILKQNRDLIVDYENNNKNSISNLIRNEIAGGQPLAAKHIMMDIQQLPKQRRSRKFSRRGLPYLGMNTTELLHSLMDQAGVGSNKGNLYSDAQWPHCQKQSLPLEESIEYKLSQHQEHIVDVAELRANNAQSPPILPTIQTLSKLESLRFQPIFGNYFYSAFYDDREPEAAYMRVVALLKKGARPALFCHFLSSNMPGHLDPARPDRVFTSMLTYYEMCENHSKDFGGWILTCEVPSSLDPLPCEVTVSLHSAYNPQQLGNVRIPVMLLRNPAVQRLDFGICVPPLFGYIPSTTLIEFIELTKILGAQHFMFYTHQIPREIQKVLRYYERIGIVTVIPWDLPVAAKGIWYHGQLLAINDCLYRSMHKFKYVAFNDIDEFIVPHKHGNWTDMMHHIESVLNQDGIEYSGYSYQSAFFDPLLESSSRVLYDLESDLRTKSFSKVRTKVMVHAERIHELGIHHISKPVLENQKTLYIEPEVAFLHHYRKCVTDFDPRMNCQVFARDESLSRYIPTLRHNVHQTMWILKEAEKEGHNIDFLMANRRT